MNRKKRKQRIRERQLIKEGAGNAGSGSWQGATSACATGSLLSAARATASQTVDCPDASGSPEFLIEQSPSGNSHGQRQTAAAARGTQDHAPSGTRQRFDLDTRRCTRAMKRRRDYVDLCKRSGIKLRPAGLRNVNSKIAPDRMIWRRISSFTLPLEPFMDALERQAGLERLMKWVEKAFLNRAHGGGVDTLVGGRVNIASTASGNPSPGDRSVPATRLVLADWNSELTSWERVKRDGFSVEAICANLGISRWKLTQLTKEYCNLTVNEVIDGIKVRHLKTYLLGRIKGAAFELWGRPGHFAAYKIEGYVSCSEKCPQDGMLIRAGPGKQSKYFRIKPQDLFHEPKWAEKSRRTAQLVQKMWEGFDLESWALAAGYTNSMRLKRAVLTVLGKTLSQLEELLAGEIIDFYQCAEDREVRNLACRKDERAEVFRAREFYHNCEDRPEEPFLDMWSAAETGTPEWLARMAGEFG